MFRSYREQSAVRPAFAMIRRLWGVTVPDELLDPHRIHPLPAQPLPPDKAIDLLEQTIAHAVTIGRSEVDVDLARSVTERMVGMPVDGVDRVGLLAGALARCNILPEDDAEAIVARLHVTTRGLDIRPSRPNAVILLADEAATQAPELASIIARELFGAEQRVVEIDLGPMANDHDVTRLLGSSPGYVGYEDHLPLHDVRQTPWCVLRLDAVNNCHPAIREVVVRALTEGFFTDAQSRRIYLSDAVVILTANIGLSEHRPIGFGASERRERNQTRDAVARALGDALANQCDLVCDHVPGSVPLTGTKPASWSRSSVSDIAHGLECTGTRASFIGCASGAAGSPMTVTGSASWMSTSRRGSGSTWTEAIRRGPVVSSSNATTTVFPSPKADNQTGRDRDGVQD